VRTLEPWEWWFPGAVDLAWPEGRAAT
jgi:hypothetical protein